MQWSTGVRRRAEVGLGRDRQLSDAFVGLADTLGEDFDMIDLFERLAAHCVALSSADAAGVMVSDGRGAEGDSRGSG